MYVDNIIRTMNTKHEWCGMAFLLQAAHKIAVRCPHSKNQIFVLANNVVTMVA